MQGGPGISVSSIPLAIAPKIDTPNLLRLVRESKTAEWYCDFDLITAIGNLPS